MAKYRNVKTAGFDSKREAKRAQTLKIEESAGLIADLQFQVKYELVPAQYIAGKCVERAISYKADFAYKREGLLVIEDSKGYKTPEYIIKRKLMLWMHGIQINET